MPLRSSWLALLLFVPACTASAPPPDAPVDGGPDCSAGHTFGCPCEPSGTLDCDARPTLMCLGGFWTLVADACGERDAGSRDAGRPDAPVAPVDAPADAPRGTGSFGGDCETGADCASGVCWDMNEIDPYCFGRGCGLPCASDAECRDAATEAGAPTPDGATCDTARGECDLQATGLVAIACA